MCFYSSCPTLSSGRGGAAGGLSVSEGGLPHGVQEVIRGDRRRQAALRPRQPAVCRGAAALGRRAVSHHGGEEGQPEHDSKYFLWFLSRAAERVAATKYFNSELFF